MEKGMEYDIWNNMETGINMRDKVKCFSWIFHVFQVRRCEALRWNVSVAYVFIQPFKMHTTQGYLKPGLSKNVPLLLQKCACDAASAMYQSHYQSTW